MTDLVLLVATYLIPLSFRTTQKNSQKCLSVIPAGLRSHLHALLLHFFAELQDNSEEQLQVPKHNSCGIAIPPPLRLGTSDSRSSSFTTLGQLRKSGLDN